MTMADPHLERLLESLQGTDGMGRKRARETLALVGESAVGPLQGLLFSPHKQTRWEAAKTLAAIIDPGSIDLFVRSLSDPHPEIRWLAASGLIGLGPRSVAPVLDSLLRPSLSRGQLESCRRILRQLSADNDVLAGIVGPVIEALESSDSTPIPTKAARALSDLDEVTGRLP